MWHWRRKSGGQEVWGQARVSTAPRALTAWLVEVLHSPPADRFQEDNRDRGLERLNLPPEAQTLSSLPAQNLFSSDIWRLPICFSPSILQLQIYLLPFLVSDTHGAPCSAPGISAIVAEQRPMLGSGWRVDPTRLDRVLHLTALLAVRSFPHTLSAETMHPGAFPSHARAEPFLLMPSRTRPTPAHTTHLSFTKGNAFQELGAEESLLEKCCLKELAVIVMLITTFSDLSFWAS